MSRPPGRWHRHESSRTASFPYEWVNDFSAAREFSFQNTTGDWLFWLDADDTVQDAYNLPVIVSEAPPATEAIFLKYIYARDDYGNSICELYRERLIRKGAPWRWQGRIHECLVPERASPARRDPRVTVLHERDPQAGLASIRRNVAILEDEERRADGKPDGWILHYLGREYQSLGDLNRALDYCRRASQAPGLSTEVRYQVEHRISEILRTMGRSDAAIDAEFAALRLSNEWADAYLGLGESYWQRNEWVTALKWIDQGLQLPCPDGNSVTVNPQNYSVRPHVIRADCLHHLGMHEQAVAAIALAVAVRPGDPRLRGQQMLYEGSLERTLAKQAFHRLAVALHGRGEQTKLRSLLQCIPYDVQDDGEIEAATRALADCVAVIEEPDAFARLYRSSPDRGLDHALRVFPLIRSEVPDAEFHVFYGWDYFDKVMNARQDAWRTGFKRELAELLAQPGVVFRGRLPQNELARELQRASLWLYPTNFFETSCITAMEMQAAGVIPVTRRHGALPETCPGAIFVDGNPSDPEVQQLYAEQAISLWRSPVREARMRAAVTRHACSLSWSGVGREWARLFRSTLSASGPNRGSE